MVRKEVIFCLQLTEELLPLAQATARKAYLELPHYLSGNPEKTHWWQNPWSADVFIYLAMKGESVCGMLVGYKTSPMIDDTLAAQVVFNWYDERYKHLCIDRLHVLFEAWARSRGCKGIFHTALEKTYRPSTGNFYHKRGYTPVERVFYKELK